MEKTKTTARRSTGGLVQPIVERKEEANQMNEDEDEIDVSSLQHFTTLQNCQQVYEDIRQAYLDSENTVLALMEEVSDYKASFVAERDEASSLRSGNATLVVRNKILEDEISKLKSEKHYYWAQREKLRNNLNPEFYNKIING